MRPRSKKVNVSFLHEQRKFALIKEKPTNVEILLLPNGILMPLPTNAFNSKTVDVEGTEIHLTRKRSVYPFVPVS